VYQWKEPIFSDSFLFAYYHPNNCVVYLRNPYLTSACQKIPSTQSKQELFSKHYYLLSWLLLFHDELSTAWQSTVVWITQINNSWFSCDVIVLQNKKNINPSEVLVLSYARPSKNLTFCNVWARQGSSLCNRVCLNFQVCALRDIKLKEWKRSRAGQKMSNSSSFGYLNSSCSRRNIDFDVW